jgi:hypothetical protein
LQNAIAGLALEAERVQSAVAGKGENPWDTRASGCKLWRGGTRELQKKIGHDFLGRCCLLQDVQNVPVDGPRVAIISCTKALPSS